MFRIGITILIALAIATVAAGFSVVGLQSLFVGTIVGVTAMGIAIEAGKVILLSLAHHFWAKINLIEKSLFTMLIAALMLITSLGIYGYLQSGYDVVRTQVEQHQTNINQYESNITDNRKRIDAIVNGEVVTLDIDTANENIKNKKSQIDNQIKIESDELKNINESLLAQINSIDTKIETIKTGLRNDIATEQKQIDLYGDKLANMDTEIQKLMDLGSGGLFKTNGIKKADKLREAQKSERMSIDAKIKERQQSISQLRVDAKNRIDSMIKSADKLREQTTANKSLASEKIDKLKIELDKYVVEQNKNIKEASAALKQKDADNEVIVKKLQDANTKLSEKITNSKLAIASTDIGTYKFVSDLTGLSQEQVVNMFIFLLIFVFDPSAVYMVLLSNRMIKEYKKPIKKTNSENTPEPLGESIVTKDPIVDTEPEVIPEDTKESGVIADEIKDVKNGDVIFTKSNNNG